MIKLAGAEMRRDMVSHQEEFACAFAKKHPGLDPTDIVMNRQALHIDGVLTWRVWFVPKATDYEKRDLPGEAALIMKNQVTPLLEACKVALSKIVDNGNVDDDSDAQALKYAAGELRKAIAKAEG